MPQDDRHERLNALRSKALARLADPANYGGPGGEHIKWQDEQVRMGWHAPTLNSNHRAAVQVGKGPAAFVLDPMEFSRRYGPPPEEYLDQWSAMLRERSAKVAAENERYGRPRKKPSGNPSLLNNLRSQ